MPGTYLGDGSPAASGGACADRIEGFPAPPRALSAGPVQCEGGLCLEGGIRTPFVAFGQLSAAGGEVWGLSELGIALARRTNGVWETRCLPPGARSLSAIHVAGRDDVWVSGDGGFIAHWDGSGWTRTAAPTSAAVVSIAGDTHAAFAAAGDGSLLTWDGNSWTTTYRGDPVDAWAWRVAARGGSAIAMTREVLVWSSGTWQVIPRDGWRAQAIWVSPAGEAWVGGETPAFDPLARAVLFRVAGTRAESVPLPDGPERWYHSVAWIDGTDDETWVQLGGDAASDIARRSRDRRWSIAVPRAELFGGGHLVVGPGDALLALAAHSVDGFGGGVRAPGSAPRLYQWTRDIGLGGPFPPIDVDSELPSFTKLSASDDELWLSGTRGDGRGALWRRAAGGWQEFDVGGGRLIDVAARGRDNAWAIGVDTFGNAFALRWDGRALTPLPLPFGGPDALAAVATASPTATWVATRFAVHRWDGATWTTVLDDETPRSFTRLWAASEDEVWALGIGLVEEGGLRHASAKIRRITSAGVTVHDVLDYQPVAIWGSSGNDVWISAVRVAGCDTRGACYSPAFGLLLLHWDGTRWTRTDGRGLRAIAGTSASDAWGVTSWSADEPQAKLQHFDGAAWRDVAALEYGFIPEELVALPGGELWGIASGRIVHRRIAQ